MTGKTTKERDYTLDFIRFMAICLVVVIHVSNYYCRYLDSTATVSYFFATLYNSLARISVPLFFMISGALMLSQQPKDRKLARKIVHFISVLIIWTIIYLIFDVVYMKYTFSTKEIVNLIFEPLKPHLWFMYAIIALYIVTPFAYILVHNMNRYQENMFIVMWAVATGGVQILRILLQNYNFDAEITYELPLVQGTYYMGYYMIGNILYRRVKEHRLGKIHHIGMIYTVNMLIVFLATLLFTTKNEIFFADLLAYRNIFVICASMSAFVLLLKSCDIHPQKIRNFLADASPYLFGVYLLHIIPFDLLIRTINIRNVNAFIGVPFFSALIFIVTFLCVYGLNKTPIGKYMM